jgi:hypothetical protein
MFDPGRINSGLALVLGGWLFVSPSVLGTAANAPSTWNAWVVGGLILVAALSAFATPGHGWTAYAVLVLGAWLFLAPWFLGFSHLAAAAWNSWIVGVLAIAAGAFLTYHLQGGRHGRVAAV